MKHPAPYSNSILEVISQEVPKNALCFDPFAGTGKIDQIDHAYWVGMELEEEWARMSPVTLVGDIFQDIPDWWEEFFDFIVTSPCYGNRYSDHHNAKDGSERRSYKHDLGRDLDPNNSGQIPWGDYYRAWHAGAWQSILFTLCKGGKLILNVSNHIRKSQEQHVWEWHVNFLIDNCELTLEKIIPVETPRMRKGKHYQARVNCEYVFVFVK